MSEPNTLRGHAALHRVKPLGPKDGELSKRLWARLQEIEVTLTTPHKSSIGQRLGDRLTVQWWTDESTSFFALQVLDQEQSHQWEIFHIPMPDGQALAGRRSVWRRPSAEQDTPNADGGDLLDLIWQDVFSPDLGEPVDVARHPSYLDILAAGLTTQTTISVRDETATIANLTADLDYWKSTAKSLAKSQNRPLPAPTTIANAGASDGPVDAPAEPTQAWKLRDIDRWAAENASRIIIMPRAASATKRSHYEDDAFLYECLELLANEYTGTKSGALDRHAFRTKADAMGLAYGGSVQLSAVGKKSDDYFIRWRGQRRFLDQHLTRGTTRDPRYTLRIYFTWDEVDQIVVVGWMPSHLGTSQS